MFGIGISSYLIILNYWSLVAFIVLLILMTFSTYYSLSIDTNAKTIVDSFAFFWITTRSETIKFDRLRNIRIDKERNTYTANSRGRTSQTDYMEYIGVLEYNDDQSTELTRKINYKAFSQEMKRMADQLNIPVNRTF